LVPLALDFFCLGLLKFQFALVVFDFSVQVLDFPVFILLDQLEFVLSCLQLAFVLGFFALPALELALEKFKLVLEVVHVDFHLVF